MTLGVLKTIIHEDDDAARRLEELGTSVGEMHEIIRNGEYARAGFVEDDPLTAGGYDAYRYRVRGIRGSLRSRGWSILRQQNLEMTLSPCGSRAIITRGGDEGVGLRDANPQPRRNVGEVAAKAMKSNGTLPLNPDWLNAQEPKTAEATRFDLWMLLVYRDGAGDLVRSELSLAKGITSEGRVLRWIERIILPVLDLMPDPAKMQVSPAPPEVVEVPVARRRR